MSDIKGSVVKARTCFGHLGGELGERLFLRLIELGWFEREEGKKTVYRLTEKGRDELKKLNVDLDGL